MRKLLIIFILISGYIFSDEGAGTTAIPLSKVGFGSAPTGMGEAYIGLSDDINSLLWNPGGLQQMNTGELVFNHHFWFAGIFDENIGIVYPISPLSTIGGYVVSSATGGIEYWNEDNLPSDPISYFSGIFGFCYNRGLSEKFAIGGALKFYLDLLYQNTGFSVGSDIGIHYRISKIIGVGAVAKNLSPGLFYSGTTVPIPISFGFGIGLHTMYGRGAIDLNVPLDNKIYFNIGYEYPYNDMFSFRLGFRTGPQSFNEDELKNPLNMLTYGLGFTKNKLKIGYTLAPYGKLGFVHRLGINYIFGERPQWGHLIVKVLDEEKGTPILADLKIEGVYKYRGANDGGTGEYAKRKIPPGKIKITASRKEYIPATKDTIIYQNRTTEVVLLISHIPPGDIAGTVYDVVTKEPLDAIVRYIDRGKQDSVLTKDGNYKIGPLKPGSYLVMADPINKKYYPQKAEVNVESEKTTRKDFALIREKEVIVLRNIYFETGKADLLPESYPVLDKIGKILIDNPGMKMEIAGHTDVRPIHSKEFPSNIELSKARAEAVKKYLVEKFNIEPSRLIAKGYGETVPVAPNNSDENMALNRRTEFKVISGVKYYMEFQKKK